MKKRIAALLAMVICISVLVSACGSDNTGSADTSKINNSSSTSEVVSKDDSNSDVIEDNKSESTKMTLYYSNTTDWADPIIQEFQDETGIEVELVNAGASELFSRIAAESQNPLADVVWGGSADTYATYKDYLTPYTSTQDEYINQYCKFEGNYYYGWCLEPSLIYYNTNLVTEEEAPKSWADLTDTKWKGQISLADPLKSGSAYACLVTFYTAMNFDDDKLAEFVENLDGKLVNSSTNAYKFVADGEYKIGMGIEEMATKFKESGSAIELIYPEEGIPMGSSTIALIKDGKNTENGQKFIDFILSEKVQSQMGDLYRRSCRTDIEDPDTLPALETLPILEEYDPTWAVENGKAFSELFRDLSTS